MVESKTYILGRKRYQMCTLKPDYRPPSSPAGPDKLSDSDLCWLRDRPVGFVRPSCNHMRPLCLFDHLGDGVGDTVREGISAAAEPVGGHDDAIADLLGVQTESTVP